MEKKVNEDNLFSKMFGRIARGYENLEKEMDAADLAKLRRDPEYQKLANTLMNRRHISHDAVMTALKTNPTFREMYLKTHGHLNPPKKPSDKLSDYL